ncbi:transcriptional regulator [Nocardioides mesophilus]|uniref:Transcriptional regulator n=2 Tax=Nocardioides mesophilus TaxID=433659 RepID=A0A7G9RHH0_9ACTN|nr:transcriptional regulator [Nocardioides mesophilus]
MAVLTGSTSSDFAFLREHLGVSDSDLSKQAAALEAAGYVSVTKSGRGRGAVTAYRATRLGRRAYDRHRATLRGLLGE